MSRLTPNRAGAGAHGKAGLRLPELQSAAADHGPHQVVMPLDYSPAPIRAMHESHGRLASNCCERVGLANALRSRAVADVRRPAAAGGHRPVADQPAGPAPGRRADRQSRFAHQRRNPADVPAAQCRGDHGHPGDARSQGGRLRASHDPHRRRPDRRRRPVDSAGGDHGQSHGDGFEWASADERQNGSHANGDGTHSNGNGHANGNGAAHEKAAVDGGRVDGGSEEPDWPPQPAAERPSSNAPRRGNWLPRRPRPLRQPNGWPLPCQPRLSSRLRTIRRSCRCRIDIR